MPLSLISKLEWTPVEFPLGAGRCLAPGSAGDGHAGANLKLLAGGHRAARRPLPRGPEESESGHTRRG